MRIKYLLLLFFIGLLGCNRPVHDEDQTYLLQSTLWYQHSAEMAALYHQAFNWATIVVKESSKEKSGKPLAVVLDIDETILDNSPSTGYQIIENVPFSESLWENWCNKMEAEPLPGSVAFTQYADNLGVEVFYISNRVGNLSDCTIANLIKHGFPNADTVHILLKHETSSKDLRREKIEENYEIILYIGDNLGDFAGSFDNRTNGIAKKLVEDRSELFGSKYIILPNPMYGSWEKELIPGDGTPFENRKSALKTFQ